MQAVKNGIKSIFRTPGKTVLFVLIFALIAALTSVAFCVFSSVRGYLRDCDGYFSSIVDLEFIGKNYPNRNYYDEALVNAVREHGDELDALIREDGVISFEREDCAAALFTDLRRSDSIVYDGKAALAVISIMSYYEDSRAYSAIIEQTLSAVRDYEGRAILFRFDHFDDPGMRELRHGEKYLVYGHFFSGQNGYPWFNAEDAVFELDGELTEFPALTPYEGEIPEEYSRLAALLGARNDACRVQRTSNIEDLLVFHQQMMTLTEGRFFTEEEYASSARVIIVPEQFRSMLGVGLGDKTPLVLCTSNGNIYNDVSREGSPEEYEIVGFYARSDDYPFWVFMPDEAAAVETVSPATGCRLGQFRLENSKARAFVEKAQPLTEHGFRLTLYDQGYSAATEPMRELYVIAVVFLAVCLLLAAAALALQCHVFVSRQRETAQTMLALGSGKAHVFVYFIAAAMLLAVPAAALGCTAGKLAEGRVIGLLARFTEQFAQQDLRYSVSCVALTKTLSFEPKVPARVYISAAFALMIGSVLMTALFTAGCVREGEKNRKKRAKPASIKPAPIRKGRSSNLSCSLKYGVLSLFRGRLRSVSVIVLALIAALFFGRLVYSLEGYRVQLESFKRETVIKGRATDPSGRLVDGILVRIGSAREAAESGLIPEHNTTITICHARFIGIPITADGTEQEVPEPLYPVGEFALETFYGQLAAEPTMVCTGSVSQSPLFYYTGAESVTWLPGCGEEDFLGEEWICALPAGYMEQNGISLGDTVRFQYGAYDFGGYSTIDVLDIRVVASYLSANDEQIIFFPMGVPLVESQREGRHVVSFGADWRKSFNSFTFTLEDNSRLDELRQTLEDAGFDEPKPGKRSSAYAVIDDENYLNLTRSMERQIQYVTALDYTLYVIAGVIGAVLAWLLTSSRRKEIAVMRALGTQPHRIVLNFLMEQAVLCALGLGLGVLIRLALGRPFQSFALILTAAFFAVWCASTFICLMAGLKKQTYASLSEPE